MFTWDKDSTLPRGCEVAKKQTGQAACPLGANMASQAPITGPAEKPDWNRPVAATMGSGGAGGGRKAWGAPGYLLWGEEEAISGPSVLH